MKINYSYRGDERKDIDFVIHDKYWLSKPFYVKKLVEAHINQLSYFEYNIEKQFNCVTLFEWED